MLNSMGDTGDPCERPSVTIFVVEVATRNLTVKERLANPH